MRHLKLLRDSMKRILLHGQQGLQNMNGYAQKGILMRLGNCVHNCILLRLSLVSLLLMRHQCLLWRLCYYIRKASAWYSLSKLLLICMLAFLLIAYCKKMGSGILFFFFEKNDALKSYTLNKIK